MTEAPNYREVKSCCNCEHCSMDYDWYTQCKFYKDCGAPGYVCDEWEKQKSLIVEKKEVHAEFIVAPSYVGGETIITDEMIVEGVVLPKPFIGIFKGDKISITGYGQGEEKDYIVVSIDEHGMTVEPVEDV